ncbi:MAG: ECF transporter S component [Clostridia bacterium]|nr:ECF transporter S component [Clostridia bacterium]
MARRISSQHQKIFRLTMLAVLTAIVLVLQLTGTGIKIPVPGTTSISLTLVPIVLGAMILGPAGGAWLGFMFGLVTYVMGATGADGFTFILFSDHPILTALVCFGKGICAGLFAGLVYKALMKVNPLVATFVSAAVAPIANTGLFILGALTMSDTLGANFVADGTTVIYFLVIGCAGLNFIFEFILNMVVAPALNVVMMHLGLVPKNREDK